MLIVHVHIKVKPEKIEAFKTACIENAKESLKEPGIACFDLLQSHTDAASFMLVEGYRSPQAAADHKTTSHYKKWAEAMPEMMSEPRFSVKFNKIFTPD